MAQNDIAQTFQVQNFRHQNADPTDANSVEFRNGTPGDLAKNAKRVWVDQLTETIHYTIDGVSIHTLDGKNIIDVRSYGAKGNGTTDDTSAFVAAAADLNDYMVYYIPPGNYRVTLQGNGALSFVNKNNFAIIGNGARIFNDPLVVTNATPNVRMIRFRNCKNFRVSGVHFLYQISWASSPTSGLVRDEQLMQIFSDTNELCDTFSIDDNEFEYNGPSLHDPLNNVTNRFAVIGMASQTALGVYERNVRNFSITGNKFTNCTGRVVYPLLCENGTVANNVYSEFGKMVNPDLSFQYFATAVAFRPLASRNITFTGNAIRCYSGPFVNGADKGTPLAIVVGSGDLPGEHAENITCTGNTINIERCGFQFVNFGVCDNVVIEGNTVIAKDTSLISYGIRSFEDGGTHKNLKIEGNSFSNLSTFYFFEAGTETAADYVGITINNNNHILGNNTNVIFSTPTKTRSIVGTNYYSDKGVNCRGVERQRIIYAFQLPPLTGSYTPGDICINTGYDLSICPVTEWTFEFNTGGVNFWRVSQFTMGTTQPALPVVTDNEKLQFRGLKYFDTTTGEAETISWGGLTWFFANGSRLTNLRKGTTAQRPVFTTSARNISYVYLDTTLAANGKPIFWTGTAWVDSTGTTV